MAKDRLSSLLVAGIIGVNGYGILSWAQKGTRVPLSLMDSMMKVTFPAYSRLQDHPELLKKTLEKSIFFVSFMIFPALAGISLVAPDFIQIIPKYSKWAPAIFPLYLLCLNAAIAAVTTPLTNAFNAVGRITLTTKLMVMWTALTWIFYPFLSIRYGYLGTAWATLLVGLSSFVVWYLSDKIFNTNIFILVFKPFVATIIMIVALVTLSSYVSNLYLLVVLKVVLGLLVYFSFHWYFSNQEIKWFWNQLKCLLVKK